MKIRIHALAKELGLKSSDLLAKLEGRGLSLKSASSSLEERIAQDIRKEFTAGAKKIGRTPIEKDQDPTLSIKGRKTKIIVPEHLSDRFLGYENKDGKRIEGQVEVLKARGIDISEDGKAFLSKLLNENPRVWTVELQRPSAGAVFELSFERGTMPTIFDCKVFLLGNQERLEGNHSIRVSHVLGSTAYCERTEDEPKESNPEATNLLLFSSEEVTLLADMIAETDFLYATDIWPTQLLPLQFQSHKPRNSPLASKFGFYPILLARSKLSFKADCDECDGSGRLNCKKCGGDGHLQPEDCGKCNGAGDFTVTCKKCRGDGDFTVTCRKCSGSGNYGNGSCYSCDGSGERTFDCNPCNGTGSRTFTCKVCDGSSLYYPPCRVCSKEGTIPCRKCEGTGFNWVNYLSSKGSFMHRKNEIDANRVSLVLEETNKPLNDTVSARKNLEKLLESCGPTIKRSGPIAEKLAMHCEEVMEMVDCLELSMELAATPNEAGTLIKPQASLKRSAGGVIYEFKVARKADWMDGKSPLSIGSHLEFETRSNKKIEGWYEGAKQKPNRVFVRFPVELELDSLPAQCEVKPKAFPPAELKQISHLQHWTRHANRDHPVLFETVEGENSELLVPKGLKFFNGKVKTNERQREAVEVGLSNAPFVLLKGPPGTGKTTVITEIVLQSVARGEKVLVCSQTNQAVRNVLEKLDDTGGVCMLRHGHEAKFSELEKSYSTGSLAGEMTKVGNKSRESLESFREKKKRMELAIPAMKKAMEASISLHETRQELENKHHKSTLEAKEKRNEADQVLENSLKTQETDAKKELKPLLKKARLLEKSLRKAESKIGRCENGLQRLEKIYQAKTGMEIPRIEFEEDFFSRLRALLPNFLVGKKTWEENHTRFRKEIDRQKIKAKEIREFLEKLASSINSIRDEKEALDEVARQIHAKDTEGIDKEEKKALSDIAREEKKAESKYLPPQEKAQGFAKDFEADFSADSDRQAWNRVEEKARKDSSLLEKKIELSETWNRDLLANPEGVHDFGFEATQVFFSTCVGIGSWRDLVTEGRDAVDLVIIDESGHATTSETLMPILYSERAILIGDEKQLPPIIPNNIQCTNECRACSTKGGKDRLGIRISGVEQQEMDCWLGKSLFEKLWMDSLAYPKIMLETQFRMHPKIAEFVSETFYEGKLRSGVRDNQKTLRFDQFQKPICLIPTMAYKNERYEQEIGTGYANDLEARIISRILDNADKTLEGRHEFGIIAPYAAQIDKIGKLVGKNLSSYQNVAIETSDIASVDSFQGAEKDVIIISFVRSPKPCGSCKGRKKPNRNCQRCEGKGWIGKGLSFVRDLQRLNVAFSRARKMLILVGDVKALEDPRYYGQRAGAKILKDFHSFIHKKGKVLHVWEKGYED